MYGAVVTPSTDADWDVFFLHNEGYSTMCGHAIIALTKLAVELGLVPRDAATSRVDFNVPAGRINAWASLHDGVVGEVSFRNVPSFVLLRDRQVDVAGLGRIRFDVAYGGAFYAIVDAEALGLELTASNVERLIDYGRRVKLAVAGQFPTVHPFEPELSFLYGTIFTGPSADPAHHSRNVCIFANGEVDRSATGSGVSARAALHDAQGQLAVGERATIESILSGTMTVEIVAKTTFGSHDAVVPQVSGTAHITGQHEFYFDPQDPLRGGFILR